jgi:hypothetical protein
LTAISPQFLASSAGARTSCTTRSVGTRTPLGKTNPRDFCRPAIIRWCEQSALLERVKSSRAPQPPPEPPCLLIDGPSIKPAGILRPWVLGEVAVLGAKIQMELRRPGINPTGLGPREARVKNSYPDFTGKHVRCYLIGRPSSEAVIVADPTVGLTGGRIFLHGRISEAAEAGQQPVGIAWDCIDHYVVYDSAEDARAASASRL